MVNKTQESRSVVAARNQTAESELSQIARRAPIPDSEFSQNLGLYMPPRSLKRLMFLNHLYCEALPVHGIVMQFGVRWGRDLAIFDSLRTIHEPFNISRKIVGFDTFDGFPSIDQKDGSDPMIVVGGLGTAPDYYSELSTIMSTRQQLDPLPDLKRFEIRKGEGTQELRRYLDECPETIVALAYFDFDLYEPTKACLELLKPFVTKGTVIAFDELSYFKTPGETVALKEVYPLNTIRVRRSPQYSGQPSYFTVE
jgi:hypothetical protein